MSTRRGCCRARFGIASMLAAGINRVARGVGTRGRLLPLDVSRWRVSRHLTPLDRPISPPNWLTPNTFGFVATPCRSGRSIEQISVCSIGR